MQAHQKRSRYPHGRGAIISLGVRCASVLSTTARSAISVSFDYHECIC